jgi:hypothetical protein
LDKLGAIAFVGFDLPLMFKIECHVRANYHSRLYTVAICSGGVLTALTFALVQSRKTVKKMKKSASSMVVMTRPRSNGADGLAKMERRAVKAARRKKFLSGCLVLSYLVYPSSSSVFFQTFNCRDIDGDRFVDQILCLNWPALERLFSTGITQKT